MCCLCTLHCDFPQLNLHFLQESWHQDQWWSEAWPRTSFVAGPAVIYLIDDPEPLSFYAKFEVFYLGSYLTLSYAQLLQTSIETKFVAHQSLEAFGTFHCLHLGFICIYLFPLWLLRGQSAILVLCKKKSWEESWALPKTHLIKVITTLRAVTEKNT